MNKKPLRSVLRGPLMYLLLLAVILLLVQMFDTPTAVTGQTLSYTELLSLVEADLAHDLNGTGSADDTIDSVIIQQNTLYGRREGSAISDANFGTSYDFTAVLPSAEQFYTDVDAIYTAQLGRAVSPTEYRFAITTRLPAPTPWWLEWVPLLVTVLLFGALWYFMMRQQAGGNRGVMNFSRARARLNDPSAGRVTFQDVAGAEEEKEELQEIVDFLKDPKRFTKLGARIPTGVLMVGPPGTGKTLLAKAVAGEAGVPFFSISGSDFVEMFVGVGASRVRDLFEQAKKSAPAFIFIDEIDAVGRQRGAGLGGGHDEREQTLNQLLVEMDGFTANQGIIVMAATNRRDILDPALMRPGRFDRQVTVNYPDQNGRVAILKVHSKGKALDENVDLDNIAKRMPYATGADLENVMNEAAILAARARKKKIDQQLLIDAIARVQMGPEKKSHKVNEKDRRMVAVHEGGHAIVGHMLEGCDEVHLITIVPRGQAAGHTLALPAEEHDNMSRSQLLDQITMMLGGHAAEEVGLGEIYTGSSSDLKRATEICRKMVTQFGMSDNIGTIYLGSDQEVFVGMEFGQSREYSEEIAAKIDREVASILADCYEKAKKILRDNREKLETLTEALLEQETLNRAEFVSLMETGTLPEQAEGDKPRTTAEILEQEKPEETSEDGEKEKEPETESTETQETEPEKTEETV